MLCVVLRVHISSLVMFMVWGMHGSLGFMVNNYLTIRLRGRSPKTRVVIVNYKSQASMHYTSHLVKVVQQVKQLFLW